MIYSIALAICLLAELVYGIKENGKTHKVSSIYTFVRFLVYAALLSLGGMYDWL
jgi:hypothetical protein